MQNTGVGKCDLSNAQKIKKNSLDNVRPVVTQLVKDLTEENVKKLIMRFKHKYPEPTDSR